MTEPRHCFFIVHGQSHPEHGYVPSLVVEGEAGHSPMIGGDELAQPWFWGKTYEEAKQVCERVNQEMFGLSPDEVSDIVISSMAAQNRSEQARVTRHAELARKLGREPSPNL